jgi:hypothetical protein
MVFYHLLMMAAALVRRTRLYIQAEQLVYLERSSIFFWRLEEMSVLFQEAHVVEVLLESPEGFIEPPLFPAYFSLAFLLAGDLKSLSLFLLYA